jgi:hypothetical protein
VSSKHPGREQGSDGRCPLLVDEALLEEQQVDLRSQIGVESGGRVGGGRRWHLDGGRGVLVRHGLIPLGGGRKKSRGGVAKPVGDWWLAIGGKGGSRPRNSPFLFFYRVARMRGRGAFCARFCGGETSTIGSGSVGIPGVAA